MNGLVRRTVLAILALSASLGVGVATSGAANAAEIHDIGSADNPTYAIVLDPQETQDFTGHTSLSSGTLAERGVGVCSNAHLNTPALWRYTLNSPTCARALVSCAQALTIGDHAGEVLALEWRPGDTATPFRCLTWNYQADPADLVKVARTVADQQLALMLQAAAIVAGHG
jgi:hypothetical protein